MTDEEKRVMLEVLRTKFKAFMEEMVKLPGQPVAKQQALFRFDEGHMWLQTAILSHEAEHDVHNQELKNRVEEHLKQAQQQTALDETPNE